MAALNAQRFASFMREYVPKGSSTGSPTFNVTHQDMRRAILACPPASVSRLATRWRVRHSGEDFYPPDFLTEAEALGTGSLLGYYPATYIPEHSPDSYLTAERSLAQSRILGRRASSLTERGFPLYLDNSLAIKC
jgi:hypothetical protein